MRTLKRSRAPFPCRNEHPEPFFNADAKGTTIFEKQDECLKMAFSERPKTMLQVSIETGIFRANICRFISKMQKQGKIQLVKFGLCPISKYRAGYYQATQRKV